ncbi:putative reverse transcriptase domain-containing protein [Tanacetum coccineum]
MVAATEPSTIQKAVQIAGTLTDETLRNGSIKKNPKKRGNKGEPSKDRNGRDDNKRTRTGNAFTTTANPVRREYTGTTPKCTACNFYHPPEAPCRTCFNCNRPGHFAKDYRVVPRNINPINARNPTARAYYEYDSTDHIKTACPKLNQAQRLGGNHQNQVVAVNGGQGRGNNDKQARGRVFMLGVEEARQDPNIITGTFTLNNHYAITLFDSGADYSFVSTTFIPLLGIVPSDLGFSYEIEIASGQLVEFNKVIKGCKLEIEGHVFDINLIPFGSGSFDIIIGMDWLSNNKAEIICHEKVVRIPLLDGKVLRVIRERSEEKMRHLRSAKTKEQKQEEILVVRDHPKVFPDDLSGLPPNREIEFRIKLEPGAIPVAKSPYRLAPSEMEELSGQLKEIQDKEVQFLGYVINGGGIHVDPSQIKAVKNWEAPRTPSEVRSFLGLGEEQENTFQTLKGKLCDAPVLALPDRPEDFMGDVRTLIMDEAHKLKYYVHPGADKMYYDLRDRLRLNIKGRLAYCSNLRFPNRNGKSAHFLPMREDYKMDGLARLYLNEIVARHGVPILIISDRDSRFTSRFWKSMQEALGTRLDMSTAYHPQIDGQKVGEGQLIGPELVQETNKKISQIKDRLKAARDRQKSVVCFGKKRKLAPRFVGPFEIVEKVGLVLRLPKELNGVHDTFHVSNLKKCLADPTLQVPLDEIQVGELGICPDCINESIRILQIFDTGLAPHEKDYKEVGQDAKEDMKKKSTSFETNDDGGVMVTVCLRGGGVGLGAGASGLCIGRSGHENTLGVAGKSRRKSFPAAVAGIRWVRVAGGGVAWEWRERVLKKMSPKPVLLSLKHAQLPVLGSTRMYRDLSLPTSGPK